MNVGSLFSGIGGMDAGLHRAGHRHVFFCEWDEWRREVLAARWPGVPIYDDVKFVANEQPDSRTHRADVAGGEVGEPGRHGRPASPDLLCGGFPCQDLSVAGKRAGLNGDRSGLFFEFARIIDTLRPRWVLLENVPGLLSSQGGRDFGTVLGTLADLGYGLGWRVLDSRFFGVPQRRRRVFIVGARADGDPAAAARRAGEVLAVGSRCPGHPPTGSQAGEDVTAASPISTLTSHKAGRWRVGADEAAGGQLVAAPLTKGSASGKGVNAPGRRQEDDVNIVAYPIDLRNGLRTDGATGVGTPGSGVGEANDPSYGMGGVTPAVAFHQTQEPIHGEEFTPAIGRTSIGMGVSNHSGVRRLTPVECERLQGLPDGWTRLDDKTPDSRRYSALGDAVTANVAEWIGARLAQLEGLLA